MGVKGFLSREPLSQLQHGAGAGRAFYRRQEVSNWRAKSGKVGIDGCVFYFIILNQILTFKNQQTSLPNSDFCFSLEIQKLWLHCPLFPPGTCQLELRGAWASGQGASSPVPHSLTYPACPCTDPPDSGWPRPGKCGQSWPWDCPGPQL